MQVYQRSPMVYQFDKDYNYKIIEIKDIENIRSLSKDYIYYEILNDIVKPFFDIDIYDIKYKIDEYEKYYSTLFKLIFPNSIIAISSSHNEDKKLSYHFVINNYKYKLRELDEFIKNHPILSMDNNIDKTIYTMRPSHYEVNFLGHDKVAFRLPYSYKTHDDKRIKIPCNYNNDLSKHIVSHLI